MPDLNKITEFDWDQGNKNKNEIKHRVTNQECEYAFSDKKAFLVKDEKHSTIEPRFILLAKSLNNRHLSVIFTYRQHKVRVISARNMNKNERTAYEKV